MPPLNLSIAYTSDAASDYLRELLARFGQENRSETQMQILTWENMWPTLRKAAVSKSGPDVSEVGSTWIGSFAGMAALRPFAPHEVAAMGGAQSFPPSLWVSATLPGDPTVWAIPWLAEARVMYYWRDMLEAAGIDEATAFETPEQTDETFARLQASGIESPWIAPTTRLHDTLHHIASWVWQRGGDFAAADGAHVRFSEPEALEGMSDYFRLFLYLPQDRLPTTEEQVLAFFLQRRAAAMMAGPWILTNLRSQSTSPDALDGLGISLPPGPPFVGNSNLVIWDHIDRRYERLALELVSRLMSLQAQYDLCIRAGMLPVLFEALNTSPYSDDPHLRLFGQALQVGRPLPSFSLWGMIEERLGQAFGQIWTEIMKNPQRPIDSIVASQLEPLAQRLDRTLSQE